MRASFISAKLLLSLQPSALAGGRHNVHLRSSRSDNLRSEKIRRMVRLTKTMANLTGGRLTDSHDEDGSDWDKGRVLKGRSREIGSLVVVVC